MPPGKIINKHAFLYIIALRFRIVDVNFTFISSNGFSGQNCFPENVKRKTFYHPIERGYEREIKKRLNWWNKLRNQNE